MRGYRNSALMASMLVASMAVMVTPREEAVEQDTTPAPLPPEKPTNLPGETNRQFAARMKAERAA